MIKSAPITSPIWPLTAAGSPPRIGAFAGQYAALAILLTAFLLTACSNGANGAPEEAAQRDNDAPIAGVSIETANAAELATPKPAIRLYTLDCGRIEMLDLGLFDVDGAFDGRRYSAANPCYLIRHPSGDLLWDSGLPDAMTNAVNGVTNGPFHLSMPMTLQEQLAGLDLDPEDIEFFALSHSHFDHVGNANLFAYSTLILPKAEYDYMFRDEAREDETLFSTYNRLEKSAVLTFDDEFDVFGDGAVRILAAPGHTPGHAVLSIDLPSTGMVLLSGDLYHLNDARAKQTVPRFNTDIDETRRSMDQFEAVAKDAHAMVVVQHDMDTFMRMPPYPNYLD